MGLNPKTVDEPACDSSNPMMCRMTVVFPAPFFPTRPKTIPLGTSRSILFRAFVPLFIYNSGYLKFSISMGNGIGIENQLLRQISDCWQLITGPQRSGSNEIFHLIHYLQINRCPVFTGNIDIQICNFVHSCTITLIQDRMGRREVKFFF